MKQINHVILVNYQPLTLRLEEDFYVQSLRDAGFSLTYWDLTGIYFKDMKVAGQIDRDYVVPFRSLRDVRRAIAATGPDTLFILVFTVHFSVLRLMRILTLHQSLLSHFARGKLPTGSPAGVPPLLKTLRKFRFLRDGRMVSTFVGNKLTEACKGLRWIKPYDILFAAGSEGVYSLGPGARIDLGTARIVHINSIDYDRARRPGVWDRLVEGPYCAFMDEYLPYHPDFKMMGMPTVDPVHYYRAMNAFFQQVEEQLKLKVVIAAHPKADYTSNPFEGRPLFTYKTPELARWADLIIAHSSTSISYAAIYERPLVLVYEGEMERLYKHTNVAIMASFARELDVPILKLSQGGAPLVGPFAVNGEAYRKYRYKYLTSPSSEHAFSREIIPSGIRAITVN